MLLVKILNTICRTTYPEGALCWSCSLTKSHHKLLHFLFQPPSWFFWWVWLSSPHAQGEPSPPWRGSEGSNAVGPRAPRMQAELCRWTNRVVLHTHFLTLSFCLLKDFDYIKCKYSFTPVGFPSAFTENTPPLYFCSDYQQIGCVLVNVKPIFPVQFLQDWHM